MEMVPARGVEIHLNARQFLEDAPCQDCLKVVKVQKDMSSMVLTATIQMTHPFTGLAKYTGFDVRGVVITNGSHVFPTLSVTMPDVTMGDFTLINPDGYTRMWNTVDFPRGSGPLNILEYSKGKFATAGGFTGTVNPYIEFSEDPRSSFPAGGSMLKDFQLKIVPGGVKFGYAVDASWAPPTIDPPTDLMSGFSGKRQCAGTVCDKRIPG